MDYIVILRYTQFTFEKDFAFLLLSISHSQSQIIHVITYLFFFQVLEALLVCLSRFVVASRVLIVRQGNLKDGSPAKSDLEALAHLQDCCVVQHLLDLLHATLQIRVETSEEFEESCEGLAVSGEAGAVRVVLCKALHDIYIEKPQVMKTVHFQGYPLDLIPLVVAGVPSMHFSLKFISELLLQPSAEHQVFAVRIAAQVSLQYPIPYALQVCKDVLNHLRMVHERGRNREEVLIRSVQLLPLLVRAFPSLGVEIVEFLCLLQKESGPAGINHTEEDISQTILRAIVQESFSEIVETCTRGCEGIDPVSEGS
tara:strand:- start:1496 stop:2431 length:936 start_codon:yes stop_codon:yes gene_type:complete